VKKLERLKLVKGARRGKEKVVAVTPEGEAACERYAAIREELLVKSMVATDVADDQLSAIAERTRVLSGRYDQACRAAASL
jgi:predicted MarR family transcription regulator